MTDESTRLINEEPMKNVGANNGATNSANGMANEPKSGNMKSAGGKVAAGAAGGFVAGAAVGVAGSAFAAGTETAPEAPVTEEQVETPSEQEAILANDEGVRYAHVENAANFGEAFAQARAQVGPGGVFEYNGRVYATYTAEEWNNMSASERTDFQSSLGLPTPEHHAPQYHPATTPVDTHDSNGHYASADVTETHETVAHDAQMLDVEPVDAEVQVIGVETVETADGPMNMALISVEGEAALLVDITGDGVMDVLVHDDNENGTIEAGEVHDISLAGIQFNELEACVDTQNGDSYLASYDDGLPDYTNDADMSMTV